MAGFSKVFSTIWGGSLHGHFEASAVFLVFLSLADREGVVDMTPEAIAGTTGWPLDFISKGISELEAPDARSRTEGHDGRRILRMDDHRPWGWLITNYALYRDKMRSADRQAYLADAQRKRREKLKASTSVNSVNSVNHNQPIAEAEAEAEAKAKSKRVASLPVWLNAQAWAAWEQYRRESKKKLTPSTIAKQLKFLEQHRNEHVAIINQSIEKGWQGLFEIRGDNHGTTQAGRRSAIDRVRDATARREAERQRRAGADDRRTLEADDQYLRPQMDKPVR